MRLKKVHIIGIVAAVIIIIVNFFLFFKENINLFYFISGVGGVIAAMPFMVNLILDNNKEKENNEMFLEFSRNLVESVKSGTPISKSIIILKNKNFGTLSPYIQKLANQISLGIPVKEALLVFAKDVDSMVITRAITLISEAEKAGGEIDGILESVAKSIGEIEILKKERRAAIYGIVVQGYIIFFIFVVIMLIMQFKILPMTSEISGAGEGMSDLGDIGFGTASQDLSPSEITKPMLYLLLVQGFFTGLVIGKLAEGNYKAGIKHSFIMLAASLLIFTGAKVFIK